jgi:VIT1/CCC1 family predicted Fe2+/Mn2+ transporter
MCVQAQQIRDCDSEAVAEQRSTRESFELIKPTRFSFGGTAAIVTSMALMAGFDAANASRSTIVNALLIAAVADNLTDSLSVHMYQESERLERKEVFIGTLANFATRLLLCLSFVLIVLLFKGQTTAVVGIVWGMTLLAGLSYLLARTRGVSARSEIGKHLAVALIIIAVSKFIGHWITTSV